MRASSMVRGRIAHEARRRVAAYGGPPDRLFVVGHSSGAHVGAMPASDPAHLTAGGLAQPLAGFIALAAACDCLPIRDPALQRVFARVGAGPSASRFAPGGVARCEIKSGVDHLITPAPLAVFSR